MKIKWGIVPFILLFTFTNSVSHAEGIKLALVDAQKVLNSAQEGIRLMQGLEEFVKARQKVIDLEEQEIKRLQSDLASQEPLLSPEALRVKQEKLDTTIRRYRDKVSELQREVQDKRLSALAEFTQRLEQVVKILAEKEGYDLVLDKSKDSGLILYGKAQYDSTTRIIEQMNKTFSKETKESKEIKGSQEPAASGEQK